MSIMTFVEKTGLPGFRRSKALLKISWEAEIFGVGMMEALAEMYPEYAGTLTA